jgi:hypothetical protein
MSQYALAFTSGNTLGYIGSYRIISYAEPFTDVVSIDDIFDSVSGETAGYYAKRSFRYSKDGTSWSLWIDFVPSNQSPENMAPLRNIVFDPDLEYFFEFRYMVVDTPNYSPELDPGTQISPEITMESFDIEITFLQRDPYTGFNIRPVNGLCSDEFYTIPVLFQNKNYTFDPYNINRGIALYQDLSNMVNNTFGWMVNYYRVVPQTRSKDVVLKEWTIFQVQQEKCLKVLVPNNEFPDNKVNFNQFGIDFEQPFEIHIDRGYWESFFGKGTMPQKRDVIYFQLNNRIYEIQSSYIYRDFMQQPLYFKVMLVKYQPKADTIIPDDIATTLDDITISTEELFGEDMKNEIEKITKPQQYVTITYDEDPIREKVLRVLPITRADFYVNWTLVAEHYYAMTQPYLQYSGANIEAVKYRIKAKQLANESRSFTCWFQPQNNTKSSDKTRPLLRSMNASGLGVDIDLIFSQVNTSPSQIVLSMNADQYVFNLQKQLSKDTWYALVVNWSNEFAQASVDVYVQQQASNHLLRISHEQKTIVPAVFDTDENYKILVSPLNLTNIRLFKEMLEEEHHNIVLCQLVVKDSNKAIIIDNAKPILRLPRIANPK